MEDLDNMRQQAHDGCNDGHNDGCMMGAMMGAQWMQQRTHNRCMTDATTRDVPSSGLMLSPQTPNLGYLYLR